MPISFSIDHSQKTVHAEAFGSLTYDDIAKHLHQESDAGGIPYREIIDATRATAAFDASEAKRLVEMARSQARESAIGPTAVLVSDDCTYGMFRMIEILFEDVCAIRPFRAEERAAAEAWVASVPICPKKS